MLNSLKDLRDYRLCSADGPIGQVRDLYFDEQAWVVRYLMVKTDRWLAEREVLIPRLALRHSPGRDKTLPVTISRAQIKDSPDIDINRSISRQHEAGLLRHYHFPHYWDNADMEGDAPFAAPPPSPLRSVQEITDDQMRANDGDVGLVRDVLIDPHSWAVRYLIVDTGLWWQGHQMLIAPEWIVDVGCADNTVSVDLTRRALKNAPRYDSSAPPVGLVHDTGLYTAPDPIDQDTNTRRPLSHRGSR